MLVVFVPKVIQPEDKSDLSSKDKSKSQRPFLPQPLSEWLTDFGSGDYGEWPIPDAIFDLVNLSTDDVGCDSKAWTEKVTRTMSVCCFKADTPLWWVNILTQNDVTPEFEWTLPFFHLSLRSLNQLKVFLLFQKKENLHLVIGKAFHSPLFCFHKSSFWFPVSRLAFHKIWSHLQILQKLRKPIVISFRSFNCVS